ncbi:winged helix-turn-helix domain-containing protein [Streptomyces sodiiphilus]|uniref:Winged helix-turn-helix domain-containing protein n=1 Tax=Streptomyces sodiiphilus TaxID=226217 RepID=A0ABN2PNM2_9ACTN
MLRIHVTGEDLARIRLADRPDPVWETLLSFHRLRDRREPLVYDAWRSGARRRMSGLPAMLRALVPLSGYFPDFLTPWQSRLGWDAALDALRSTPRRRLAAELTLLDGERPLPGWAGPLAAGEREAVDRMAGELDRYHRLALADDEIWESATAQVDADRALRIRHMLAGGTEGLLAGLRPVVRWNPPVLEADYPVTRELRLGGRGLLLVPSFFCWRTPITYYDDALTPVLVYPVQHAVPTPPDGRALGRLLGTTRARVLRCIEDGTTTGELARRARVSPASASQHASVLRDAGLVVSVRRGNEVLHTLTPLGAQLLPTADTPAPRPAA